MNHWLTSFISLLGILTSIQWKKYLRWIYIAVYKNIFVKRIYNAVCNISSECFITLKSSFSTVLSAVSYNNEFYSVWMKCLLQIPDHFNDCFCSIKYVENRLYKRVIITTATTTVYFCTMFKHYVYVYNRLDRGD